MGANMKLTANLEEIQELRKNTSLPKIAAVEGMNYEALKTKLRRADYKCPTRYTDYSFLAVTEKAYIAGIIDGEGHLDLNSKKLDISNTSNDLIQWLLGTLGGYCIVKPIYSIKHKKSWSWRLGIVPTRGLLKEVLPYLIIKKEPAEKLLTWIRKGKGETHKEVKHEI